MTVLTFDDLGLCNCCVCQRDLLGDRTARLINSGEAVTAAALPPPVADYVRGRPLCADCQRRRVVVLVGAAADPGARLTRILSRSEAVRLDRGRRGRPRKIDADTDGNNEGGIRALEGE